MERKANFALVGLLTLILSVGGLGFAFWLMRSDFNQTYSVYDVVFETPVNGLTKGAEVHFNGIKVGEVRSLKLGKTNTREVIATVRLDSATPVHSDSRATLEPQGVTGLVFIQISPGSEKAAMLKALTPGFEHPVIKGTEGALDRLLAGSGSVVETAYESLNRVNRLLSDENIKTFSQSIDNLQVVTASLRGREQLIDDTHSAVVSATLAADSVTQLANTSSVLMGETAPATLAKMDIAAQRLVNAADAVEAYAKALEKPTTEISETTLPQMEESMENLNKATRALTQLLDEARSSPQGLIAKAKPKERNVNP